MKRPVLITIIALTFVLGAALGSFAAKKDRVGSDAWQGASPEEAAARLLELAEAFDRLVEIGAFYNLNGDREHAEELFERGFSSAPKNLNNTLTAAGSYVGVYPRRR